MMASGDYENQVHLNASQERVFEILTTAAEFGAWWVPATGSAAEGGELRITFDGIDDPLLLRVRQATRPSAVTWDVTECAFLPDWVGTTLAITLGQDGCGGCDLRFRHEGLTPRLECYEMCRAGWEQYLPSLRDYVETGTGNPYTLARLG
jgi:uncharacterized protein YndB with AHSA1/START domain